MTPRLHVLLGAGGVGKTTLAAGYALALSRGGGRKVGLLGIDPSRRLKDALNVALGDEDVAVSGSAALRAAILEPAGSARRWAAEACSDPELLARLVANPFFSALADRLATATDIFAAARVAEWAEHDPALTDLVVDTAPGLNAIEFLTRPERVAAFLGGRLVGWLRWLSRRAPWGGAGSASRGGARRILGGLTRIGGTTLLLDMADFFSLVEAMFGRMVLRVQSTQRWLRDPTTRLLVVTSVRQDGVEAAVGLIEALRAAGLAPSAVIVNRALPPELTTHAAALEAAATNEPRAAPLIRYALAYAGIQSRILRAVDGLAPRTVTVSAAPGLNDTGRLESLTRLGEALRASLDS